MTLRARLQALRAKVSALGAELDELIDELPGEGTRARERRPAARKLQKPRTVPTELQQKRADRFMREGGYDR